MKAAIIIILCVIVANVLILIIDSNATNYCWDYVLTNKITWVFIFAFLYLLISYIFDKLKH